MLRTTLEYAVPVPVAFAYLADPAHRPEWQSSLKGVELLDAGPGAAPAVGLRWLDHTAVGMSPEMVITEMEPDVLWAETGRWKAIEADLTLRFVPTRHRLPGRGRLRGARSRAVATGGLGRHGRGPGGGALGPAQGRPDPGRADPLMGRVVAPRPRGRDDRGRRGLDPAGSRVPRGQPDDRRADLDRGRAGPRRLRCRPGHRGGPAPPLRLAAGPGRGPRRASIDSAVPASRM